MAGEAQHSARIASGFKRSGCIWLEWQNANFLGKNLFLFMFLWFVVATNGRRWSVDTADGGVVEGMAKDYHSAVLWTFVSSPLARE